MRLTFCFSRSWSPYPWSALPRRIELPCCPGGCVPRFSMGHDGLKQRSPLRNNYAPSRRHRRHTALRYLATSFLPPVYRSDGKVYRPRADTAPGPSSFRLKSREPEPVNRAEKERAFTCHGLRFTVHGLLNSAP